MHRSVWGVLAAGLSLVTVWLLAASAGAVCGDGVIDPGDTTR